MNKLLSEKDIQNDLDMIHEENSQIVSEFVDTYEEKTIKMISLDSITVYTMYVQKFLSHQCHLESLYHSDYSKEIK